MLDLIFLRKHVNTWLNFVFKIFVHSRPKRYPYKESKNKEVNKLSCYYPF